MVAHGPDASVSVFVEELYVAVVPAVFLTFGDPAACCAGGLTIWLGPFEEIDFEIWVVMTGRESRRQGCMFHHMTPCNFPLSCIDAVLELSW